MTSTGAQGTKLLGFNCPTAQSTGRRKYTGETAWVRRRLKTKYGYEKA